MNEIITKEKIENKIYEINGVEVMLDSNISVVKYHDYNNDEMITYYDRGQKILLFINFADASAKLERRKDDRNSSGNI